MSRRYIGIDLGGTKIASGVTDENGRILARAETPTLPERPYQDVVRDMAADKMRWYFDGVLVNEIHPCAFGVLFVPAA